MNFGIKIKTLRLEKNLTQKQLSDIVGVAVSAISSYESGTRYPSYDILLSLAHTFHVSTDYLLGLEKTRTIDLTGMNDKEITAVINIIDCLKNKYRF